MLFSSKDYVKKSTSYLNLLFNHNRVVGNDQFVFFNIFNKSKFIGRDQGSVVFNVANACEEASNQITMLGVNFYNRSGVVRKNQGTIAGFSGLNIAEVVKEQGTVLGYCAANYAKEAEKQGSKGSLTLVNIAKSCDFQYNGFLNIAKNARKQNGAINYSKYCREQHGIVNLAFDKKGSISSDAQHGIINVAENDSTMQYGIFNYDLKSGFHLFCGQANRKERARRRFEKLMENNEGTRIRAEIIKDLTNRQYSKSFMTTGRQKTIDYMIALAEEYQKKQSTPITS